jgi:succinoglycan biosynthesis transport protein ExoP
MNETTDSISVFSPLWRRKWLILAVGILVAAGSYFYYKRQRPVFQATTQVYLGGAAEEQAPGEKTSTKGQSVIVENQATIINALIFERVRQKLRAEHKGRIVHGGKVKARATEKSQFITVTANAHTAKNAALLANLTVQSYIRRQRATHRRVIEQAIAITRRQLRRIELASTPKPAPVQKSTTSTKTSTSTTPSTPAAQTPSTANVLQEANLNSRINQLETRLSTASAQQVKPATPASAVKLSPKPRKNAIFGFIIGVVLAAIAAYVLARLDRRLRSVSGIERILQSPILVGLPEVRRPIVSRDGAPSPSRHLLEPLRRLHTALQLGGIAQDGQQRPSRVILFTSGEAGDGKSTLTADLALVQRDAGERVAIVEADFRRPVLSRLLGLDDSAGLADVLSGRRSLDEAVQRVVPAHAAVGADPRFSGGGVATAVGSDSRGSLFLLASGGSAANPPALLAHERMSETLRALAQEFDSVLIDAPSPVEVSDVMPLLKQVDGIVVVARVGHTRETSARGLVQLLANTPCAPVLGVAANCVPRGEAERYGFSPLAGRVRLGRLIGR